MTTSNKLPAVLTFPDGKQNSISMERALNQALLCLTKFSFNENHEVEQNVLLVEASIGDLKLMLGAIER